MIEVLQTRFIHWKKQWFILLFWLVFPIIATIILITTINMLQDNTKVPVGIVMEENTPLASELYESIKATPLIRVFQLDEAEAIDQLNKHEIDSVFIIRKGYEKNIRKANRNRLILSYQSDLSFAYTPVKEMILSYVQTDSGRSKAAYVVKSLSEQYGSGQQWTLDEIIDKSKSVQTEQSLLHTGFAFIHNDIEDNDDTFTIFETWNIWALFTLLSTLLLFDWLIKERSVSIMPRFAFMRISLKSYLLQNLSIYIALLGLFDIFAMIGFQYFLNETITGSVFLAILFYRLLICLGAFLLALCFKNSYLFYSVSFVITLLIAIGSGAILPIDGLSSRLPSFEWINPLHAFLSMRPLNIWLFIFIILITIWYRRKEKKNA